MDRPDICAVIVSEDLPLAEVEPLVDLFEVRIDLIGHGWQKLVKELKKPWIACNRIADEGGAWRGSETSRIEELFKAAELGADLVDIELRTENLSKAVELIKKKTECLISYHDLYTTPSLGEMKEIVHRELEAGADVCKVVTTAHRFEDNLIVLELIAEFTDVKMVSFAMGSWGITSRILCPLAGGYFTYASIEEGKKSASGQVTVATLRKLYGMVR
jgi:3-dehydroquinate dehydratase type I